MERPYIIWTLRRTGGTSLATMLAAASSFPSLQHEPFNPDRIHGGIAHNWDRDFDLLRMRKATRLALSNRPVIKHCYELSAVPFNLILLQETARLDYHHIILNRRSEVDRIFSLELAKTTGAWGPKDATSAYSKVKSEGVLLPPLDVKKSINHMTECMLRTKWLRSEIRKLNLPHSSVSYEEIYGEPILAFEKINDILRAVGHTEEKIMELGSKFRRLVVDGKQGTEQLRDFVPNVVEWRRAMLGVWKLLNRLGR